MSENIEPHIRLLDALGLLDTEGKPVPRHDQIGHFGPAMPFRYTRSGASELARRFPDPATKAELIAFGFAELQCFFATDFQLRRALDWSAPTFRRWRDGGIPASPRVSTINRLFWLLTLADEASGWVPERHQVGEWLLEPNLELGWASPTQVITILGGEGVELMLEKMPTIGPVARFSPEEFRSPSPRVMRARLQTLPTPTAHELRSSAAREKEGMDAEEDAAALSAGYGQLPAQDPLSQVILEAADRYGGCPRISRVALSSPERSFSQDEVLGMLGLAGDEFAGRIFSRCGVERRQLSLTKEMLATTLQGRTSAIEDELLRHAIRAVDELEVSASEIGVVVSASLYSLGGPTLAHRIAEHYKMPVSADKYHLTGVGCASAVPLVRLAAQSLRDHPGKKALIVAAESMSGLLTKAQPDDARSKVVGASIFGDGCAAALVEFDNLDDLDGTTPGKKPGKTVPQIAGPAIIAFRVYQLDGTLEAVAMQVTDNDSYLHMARELPAIASEGLRGLVDEFLEENDVEFDFIDRWLVHPGGRRIIECVQEALGLPREDVEASYEVLADHGNVGTPTIFYVLQRSLEMRAPQSGEHALMVTVGPGVTVGLMLMQW